MFDVDDFFPLIDDSGVPAGVCPKCRKKAEDLRPRPPHSQGPNWCAECRLKAAAASAKQRNPTMVGSSGR
jgi:hypothetical protein